MQGKKRLAHETRYDQHI